MIGLSDLAYGIVCGLAVTLYALPTEAGFISGLSDGELASVAPVAQTRTASPTDGSPKRDAWRPPPLLDPGLAALPGEPPATGDKKIPTSRITAVSACDVSEFQVCPSQRLVTDLAHRPDMQVPVPFLSGLFRPPRGRV